MYLNFSISKSRPDRSVAYADGKNILDKPIRYNVYSDDPIQEMELTAKRFGKWEKPDERKTISMIVSPDPNDYPTTEQLINITKRILHKFFPNIQGIIAIHNDKGKDAEKKNPKLHAHFYGSIIDMISGKNVHLSKKDISEIRIWADDHAHNEYNWSKFGKKEAEPSKQHTLNTMERIMSKNKTPWLLQFIDTIQEAYESTFLYSDFENKLKRKSIDVSLRKNEASHGYRLIIRNMKVKSEGYLIGDHINEKLSWPSLLAKYPDLKERFKSEPKATLSRKLGKSLLQNASAKRGNEQGTENRKGYEQTISGREPAGGIRSAKNTNHATSAGLAEFRSSSQPLERTNGSSTPQQKTTKGPSAKGPSAAGNRPDLQDYGCLDCTLDKQTCRGCTVFYEKRKEKQSRSKGRTR